MSPIQKRAERVRGIALEPVLRLAGAQPDVHDPRKWHTSEGVLSITGPKFMNWTRGLGGGGAIDLVIHLKHRSFMEALQWLEGCFPAPASTPSEQPDLQRSLQLPVPCVQNLRRIKGYLAAQRGLPAALTDPLIASGRIYADSKANVLFLLSGQNGIPVGAEMRGTTFCAGVAWRRVPKKTAASLKSDPLPPPRWSCANQPSMPSVAVPSIRNIAASPQPAPEPIPAGYPVSSATVSRFTAATMPTRPGTPWPRPCRPDTPKSNVCVLHAKTGTTSSDQSDKLILQSSVLLRQRCAGPGKFEIRRGTGPWEGREWSFGPTPYPFPSHLLGGSGASTEKAQQLKTRRPCFLVLEWPRERGGSKQSPNPRSRLLC